jgi:hypothetical protein
MPVHPNNAPVVSVSAFHQYLAVEVNLAILHFPAVISHHFSTVLYIIIVVVVVVLTISEKRIEGEKSFE